MGGKFMKEMEQYHFEEVAQQLSNLISIAIALSSEKDLAKLLDMILSEARRITHADAGTLYMIEDNKLAAKIVHNDTMNTFLGGKGDQITIPPVPINDIYVSGYVANHGVSINIPDVYNDDSFDFSGPKKYDEMTGYLTRSMLVIPLKNHKSEVIGVLQLLNAIDKNTNEVIPFPKEYQLIIESLASLAATALTNSQLIQEIEALLDSFIQVMVTAIDSRTPYNATHTQKIASLARALAEAINEDTEGFYKDVYFDEKELKVVSTAAWLHDIGKMAVPLSVMNKATRLDKKLSFVLQRIDYAMERKINHYFETVLQAENPLSVTLILKEKENIKKTYKHYRDTIIKADNPSTFIDEELKQEILYIASTTYPGEDGTDLPLLTDEEVEQLCIQRGTLTAKERKIMEDHVLFTERMLSKMRFGTELKRVPEIACMHHEQLDGKGYPNGLKGDQIPLEARILAIVDIFDALTAVDRPYKKAIPLDKSLSILQSMAKENKIDQNLLDLFIKKRVWEKASLPL